MEKKELIHTKVIYKLIDPATNQLRNNITAQEIFSDNDNYDPNSPVTNLFKAFPGLATALKLYPNGDTIAIVCGYNFGCAPASVKALASLEKYKITIIAKSISPDFLKCSCDSLKQKLIQNTDLIVGIGYGMGIDNIAVEDNLDIQTFKVINKHKKPDDDDQDNDHTKEKDDKVK